MMMIPALQLQPTKQTTQHHNTTQTNNTIQQTQQQPTTTPSLPLPLPLPHQAFFTKQQSFPQNCTKTKQSFCPKLPKSTTIFFAQNCT
jgi:hypothetical protein